MREVSKEEYGEIERIFAECNAYTNERLKEAYPIIISGCGTYAEAEHRLRLLTAHIGFNHDACTREESDIYLACMKKLRSRLEKEKSSSEIKSYSDRKN